MNGTPVEPEIEEYKWVILPNKYTIYNEEGTTLKTENKTLNEWEPPISGDYVIQLHATGGKGGAYGTYAGGMTLLAEAGEDGGASTEISALFYNYYSEGGDGGSGSALKDANDTGAYGNGGSAGSFLGGSLPGGEGEENKAEGDTSNLGPAIIIRRKLE